MPGMWKGILPRAAFVNGHEMYQMHQGGALPKRHLFSLDPGDANNGFCYFIYDTETKIADTRIMKVYDEDGLDDTLRMLWSIGQAAKEGTEFHFVCENFRIDGKVRDKIFQWGEVVTVRQIGKFKMLAKWLGSKCVLQEPAHVLPMARKWAPKWVGMPKSGHPRDDASAWVHGVHYMTQRQWFMNPDSVIPFGQDRLT